MKIVRLIISLLVSVALVYFLNNRLPVSVPVPPLGKFLEPQHGFWQNCFPPDASGKLTTAGISGPVEVVYDSALIPHIYAASEEDLYFAQGLVTARDRLWQMEFQTHAAAGRISEILGHGKDSVYLNYDRDTRRMGLAFAAENCLDAIQADAEMNKLAARYTAGVNAWINALEYDDLPLEYKLLDYAPEPWTDLKIALLLKSMARTLNTGEKDMEMTNALALLGPEMVDLLFPDREQVGDPIVDRAGKWPTPLPADTVPLAVPDQLAAGPIKVAERERTEKDIGSNNWAVAGSRTLTGKPILCNDPHLSLGLPSIWYAVHLSAPGYNTMGASLPGAPGVISGFNDSIAWGETNAQRDLVDWYRIQFKDKSRSAFLYDSQWVATTRRVEQIQVRGKGVFSDTVVYTPLGPVRYDANFKPDNDRNQFAFRWISHDPSNEMRAFYQLNKGRNLKDYHRALDHYASPAQNFVFASVRGDIAMRIQGKFPVRRPNEGRFILDGSRSSTAWRRFIPNDHQVQHENPERGFVSSANQYPADSTYPYYVMSNSYEAFRNRRINQRLAALQKATVKDMMDLHSDNFSIKASEALPILLPMIAGTGLSPADTEARNALSSWDFQYTITSKEASLFEAWWTALHTALWDEFRDQPHDLPVPTAFQTIHLMRTQPALKFYDRVSTPEAEKLHEIVQTTFREAVAAVAKWETENNKQAEWGAYKNTTVEHLLRLPAMSKSVHAAGNREIVNATSRRAGPSWRMVVSMESPVQAWGIYPGGQSGHPGSAGYTNMIEPWSRGEYIPLEFHPRDQQKPLSVIQLIPGK